MTLQLHVPLSICVMEAINWPELHLISLSLVLTSEGGWVGKRLEHKIKGFLIQPRTFRDLGDLGRLGLVL